MNAMDCVGANPVVPSSSRALRTRSLRIVLGAFFFFLTATGVNAAVTVTAGTAQAFYGGATVNLSIAVTAGDDVAIGCFGANYSADFVVTAPGYTRELETASSSFGLALLVKHNLSTGTENVTVTMAGTADRYGWCVPFKLTGTANTSGTNAQTNEQGLTASPDYPSTGTLPTSSGVVVAIVAPFFGASSAGIDLPSGYTSVYTQQGNDVAQGLVAYKVTSATTAEDPAGGTLASGFDPVKTGVIYFSAAAVGGNAQAPTVPIALEPIVGSGTVTFRFLESVGPYDGVTTHPGVANYDVRRDNVVLSGSIDGTTFPIVAPHANVQPDPSATTSIGGGSGTSATRSSLVDWTLTGPTGTESTGGFNPDASHRIYLQSYAYTSGQAVSVKLGSLTSPSSGSYPGEYDGAGACVASGTSANSAVVAAYQAVAAGSRAIFVIERTTNGATRTSTYFEGDGTLYELLMVPSGSTWSIYRVATSGPPVLLHTTAAVSLGGSPVAGKCIFGFTGSSPTAVFRNFALRTATPVSFTLNTTVSTNVEIRARATTSGATSGWSVAQSGEGTSGPSGQYRKAYWGHYTAPDNILYGDNLQDFKDFYDGVFPNSRLKGAWAIINWRTIEASKGDYSKITTVLKNLVDYNCSEHNVPTGFSVMVQVYGASNDDGTNAHSLLPAYLYSEGYGVNKTGTGGKAFLLNDATSYGYYRALFENVAAVLDDNPCFVGIYSDESATDAEGFDESIRNAYWLQLVDDLDDDFVHSNFAFTLNWMMPVTDVKDIVAALATKGIGGLSTTDIDVPRPDGLGENHGAKVFRGAGVLPKYDYEGAPPEETVPVDFGSIDYRGVIPYLANHDDGGGNSTVSMADKWAYLDIVKPSIVVWRYYDGSYPGHSNMLFSDLMDYIDNEAQIINFTCPTSYGGNCISGPEYVP